MFSSNGSYVLSGDSETHCVCYGPDADIDALLITYLLNEHYAKQRLPHPAVQLTPSAYLDDVRLAVVGESEPLQRHPNG